MELILIRHGEPVKLVDADGPAHPRLAARGRQQAERLAEYLGTEPRLRRGLRRGLVEVIDELRLTLSLEVGSRLWPWGEAYLQGA